MDSISVTLTRKREGASHMPEMSAHKGHLTIHPTHPKACVWLLHRDCVLLLSMHRDCIWHIKGSISNQPKQLQLLNEFPELPKSHPK